MNGLGISAAHRVGTLRSNAFCAHNSDGSMWFYAVRTHGDLYSSRAQLLAETRVSFFFREKMIAGADFVVATSEQEAGELRLAGVDESPILLRRIGIDAPSSVRAGTSRTIYCRAPAGHAGTRLEPACRRDGNE